MQLTKYYYKKNYRELTGKPKKTIGHSPIKYWTTIVSLYDMRLSQICIAID